MASEDLSRRVPPYSIEAEQACIGAMLTSGTAISIVQEVLTEDDFFDEKHRLIFKTISDLADRNAPVDAVSISERLTSQGLAQQAGGSAYVSRLIDNVPSLSNVSYYSRIVMEKSVMRRLIDACRQVIDLVYEKPTDIEGVTDEAEKLIFEVTDRKMRTNYKMMKEILPDTLKGIERLQKEKHVHTGLSTGYYDLDDMTSGLQAGDMIVLAARPSMGKTAFALNICANVCRVNPSAVVMVFSLEMSYQELALRMLSSEARLEMQKIRKGQLNDAAGDWAELVGAAGRLSSMKLVIDDTPAISLNEIRAKSRRVKSRYGLNLIVIDHLQLITTSDSNKITANRNNEISYISRSIKALAKELEIPIIILSQLSRKVEDRTDKKPILSDLRESGAIEQDADLVAFLHREDYYNKDGSPTNVADLLLQKQRNGPTGEVKLAFFGPIVRFDNLDKHASFLDHEAEAGARQTEEEF